ncbi:HDL304Wp [Eremothecium sinecaudum]|uniref:HDL304Wp n=1 Tax=Eremothecium sinecaudum TaxID=45286 RepID=A0A0X8HS31_9SACH|nr:HDL304Wp [Eremothecium sinecaudum]AMD20440.1 HDL304Wp [Eremothecium sinecaudum]
MTTVSGVEKLTAKTYLKGHGEIYHKKKPPAIAAEPLLSKDLHRTAVTNFSREHEHDPDKRFWTKGGSRNHTGYRLTLSTNSISEKDEGDEYEETIEQENETGVLVNTKYTEEDKAVFRKHVAFYRDKSLSRYFFRRENKLMDFVYLNDFLFNSDKILTAKVDKWLFRQVRRLEELYKLQDVLKSITLSSRGSNTTISDKSVKRLTEYASSGSETNESELPNSETQTSQHKNPGNRDITSSDDSAVQDTKDEIPESEELKNRTRLRNSRQHSWFSEFIRESFFRKRRSSEQRNSKSRSSYPSTSRSSSNCSTASAKRRTRHSYNGVPYDVGFREKYFFGGAFDSVANGVARSGSLSSWFHHLKGSLGRRRSRASVRKSSNGSFELEVKVEQLPQDLDSQKVPLQVTVIGLNNLSQTLSNDDLLNAEGDKLTRELKDINKEEEADRTSPPESTSPEKRELVNICEDDENTEEEENIEVCRTAYSDSDGSDEDDMDADIEQYLDMESVQLPPLELEFGNSFIHEIEEELGFLTNAEQHTMEAEDNVRYSNEWSKRNSAVDPLSKRTSPEHSTSLTKKSGTYNLGANYNNNSNKSEEAILSPRRNGKGKVKRTKSRELLKRVLARNVGKYNKPRAQTDSTTFHASAQLAQLPDVSLQAPYENQSLEQLFSFSFD